MKLRVTYVVIALLFIGITAIAQETPTINSSATTPTAITGSGIKGHIPRFTGKASIGNSRIFQNGAGDVGIGTTSPAATLDVNGVVNAATSFNLGGAPFSFGSAADFNAFCGFAGNSTMTGKGNTANGYEALAANTTGGNNTAVGEGSLFNNTTGASNTANGAYALLSNTTGISNTATGQYALYLNTSGYYNTATGFWALNSNTTGNFNTADGFGALFSNTTGSQNTASGHGALGSNASGIYNTATGSLALNSNTAGGFNVAFGDDTLTSNTTGSYNTAVGSGALLHNAAGFYNTALGTVAGPDSANLTNTTAIGAFAVVSESNAMALGGTGQYAVKVGIGTATPANVFTIGQGAGHAISDGWDTYSSRRWKTNIQTLDGALGKVQRLRGVSYDLKAGGNHKIGVIAEEVGTVVPEVVSWDKDGKDAQGVDYGRLTALLIEAMKEQQSLIHEQQAQIRAQQAQISRLAREVKAVRASVNSSSIGMVRSSF
jgi:hypothetical protein